MERQGMNEMKIDRLALITLSGSQSASLMKALSREGFQFTIIDSTSGLLGEAEVCLLAGFPGERLEALLEIVRVHCKPYRQFIPAQGPISTELSTVPMVEAQLGGARLHVMEVEEFVQL